MIGLYGTLPLVHHEFNNNNICPKIIGIPACYIILSCLLMAIVSHINLLKDKSTLFYLGVVTALSIAAFGSILDFLGYLECPKTNGGTPMCYLSFLLFLSLMILKIIEMIISRKGTTG